MEKIGGIYQGACADDGDVAGSGKGGMSAVVALEDAETVSESLYKVW